MDFVERAEKLVATSLDELEEMVSSGTDELKLKAISQLMPLIREAATPEPEEEEEEEEIDEYEVLRADFTSLLDDVRAYITRPPDVPVDGEPAQLGPVVEIESDEHEEDDAA